MRASAGAAAAGRRPAVSAAAKPGVKAVAKSMSKSARKSGAAPVTKAKAAGTATARRQEPKAPKSAPPPVKATATKSVSAKHTPPKPLSAKPSEAGAPAKPAPVKVAKAPIAETQTVKTQPRSPMTKPAETAVKPPVASKPDKSTAVPEQPPPVTEVAAPPQAPQAQPTPLAAAERAPVIEAHEAQQTIEPPEPEPAPIASVNQPVSSAMPRPTPPMLSRLLIPPRPPAKPEVFAEGDHVVYPTHGVGKVERIAIEEIAGHRLELIHITFEENRMTLRVPVSKARSAGLRKLATRKLFDEAMAVLKGRARIKRTMWSRRAQEYEAKINSGDPLAIAEVVRDLHRNAGQPDQSFSERQIYESAMDRLAAELAALDKTDKVTAATKLSDFLKTV